MGCGQVHRNADREDLRQMYRIVMQISSDTPHVDGLVQLAIMVYIEEAVTVFNNVVDKQCDKTAKVLLRSCAAALGCFY